MPTGRNRIPRGGLPSRPDHWRASRKVDVAYIKELEAELHLARSHAKDLEAELAEALGGERIQADRADANWRGIEEGRKEIARLRKAVESDLLEYVNASHRRKEAQADPEAALNVGVPMACAAVELYRTALRKALEETDD